MINEERNKKDVEWSDSVAGFIAEELVAGGLVSREQSDLAAGIAAQQIHIFLVSGSRPPNSN
jgi:hypothetical protein